jgi:nucleotide-binding universal stress UspA family protein
MKIEAILVGVDSVTGSVPVIRAAIELSRKSGARLQAVFVEEDDWYAASKFTFSSRVSSLTGEILPFTESDIEGEIRAHRTLLRRLVENHGTEYHVEYHFESIRGLTKRNLLEMANSYGLFVIGRNRHPERGESKLGSNARFFMEHSEVPLLVWNNGAQWPPVMTALCQEPKESLNVIRWTLGLCRLLEKEPEFIWPLPLAKRRDFEKLYDQLNSVMPGAADAVMNNSKTLEQLRAESFKKTNRLAVIDRNSLDGKEALNRVSGSKGSVLLL